MEEAPKAEEGGGVPAWVMTFADLMTLLMCFFVLLLAFSEMDAQKFKELSGSVKNAFGVQAEIEARTIPKGTSVIAREFSPGKPQPTLINDVRQFTIDSNQNTLEFDEEEDNDELEREAERIRRALEAEIQDGALAVVTEQDKVVIHILEKASFGSGDATVRQTFKPTLNKIANLLTSSNGRIDVAGHTDNVPISTSRFRSNWELSTGRAVSVAQLLLGSAELEPRRFTVTGHADTKPRAENDTAEGRAANRRVDIRIVIGKDWDSPNVISADDVLLPREATRQDLGEETGTQEAPAP
ncbi:MAG: flagellar motor protein MotB [Pseudomonadota bacterium]